MGLTRLAINRPLTILMLVLALVIMGLFANSHLKVARLPNISFPFVSISFQYAGASPQDIEALVIEPIEQRIGGVPGIDTVNSTANTGSGSVSLQMLEGADADQAAIDVERRLASVTSQLPSGVSAPTVNKADPNAFPIMNVSVTGPLPMEQLYQLATTVVQPHLLSVLGVADIQVAGGLVADTNVALDYSKMEAYGVTVPQITSAISHMDQTQPGGTIPQGQEQMVIRSVGLIRSAAQLGDLVVATTPTGVVHLRDVASVADGYKDVTTMQRVDGQDAVGMSITQQSDANTIAVVDGVKRAIGELQRQLPRGVRLTVTNDSSLFTRESLDAVNRDLIIAVLLTALVLLLFLHSWRNVIIVIIAIPTSLISTYLVMFALGFSLDTISLMALALTVGILVDDSIVVLENIHRHLKLGEEPLLAALNGRSEIGLAALAITATDVVVYLPVAFMTGNIGQLFREYGLTIAAATLFSLFMSFTLTPMLASRWLKTPNGEEDGHFWSRFSRAWERGFDRVANGYGRLLGLGLHVRPLILIIGLAAFAAAIAMIPLHILGTEYAPQEDDNQFSVNVQLPPGSSLAAANQAVSQVENGLRAQVPEIQDMFTRVSAGGGGFFGGGGRAGGSIDVQLIDKSQRKRSVFQILNVVRRIGAGIPGATVRPQVDSPLMRGGGGGSIQVRITGADLDTLAKLSNQVEGAMLSVPGILDVVNPSSAGNPEIDAVFGESRMAALGVSADQAAATVRTLTAGTVPAQIWPAGGVQRDIEVIGQDSDRNDLAKLADIPVPSSNGGTVRLGEVAQLVQTTSPVQITRTNGQRTLTLSAVAGNGRALGDVARDLRTKIASLAVPEGYSVAVTGGAVSQLDQAIVTIMTALALSVVLVYMLMVALYESFLDPLAIMFALPVSLVGAFGGLWLTGNTINIFSMIGMIMLMGLVAKNGILLVDYTKTLRRRGLPRQDALIEAARARLRPIVMTTCTVVCAMTPLALKLEAGAESRAPMAVVMIGGVLSSTLLTLFLVPTMYTYLDDLQNLLGGLRVPKFLRWRRQLELAAPGMPTGRGDDGRRIRVDKQREPV